MYKPLLLRLSGAVHALLGLPVEVNVLLFYCQAPHVAHHLLLSQEILTSFPTFRKMQIIIRKSYTPRGCEDMAGPSTNGPFDAIWDAVEGG